MGGPDKEAKEQIPKASDVLAPISFMRTVITATHAGLIERVSLRCLLEETTTGCTHMIAT